MLLRTSVAALLAFSMSACAVESSPKTDLAARLSQLDQTPPGLCGDLRERIDALSAKTDDGRVALSEKDIYVAEKLVHEFPEPDPSALDLWVEFNQLPSSEKSAALLSALPDGACLIEFDRVSALLLNSLGRFDHADEKRELIFLQLKDKAQRVYDRSPSMLAAMLKVRLYENMSKARGNAELSAELELFANRVDAQTQRLKTNWENSDLPASIGGDMSLWTEASREVFWHQFDEEYGVALSLMAEAAQFERHL